MKNKIISNDYKASHSSLSISPRWSHKCKINLLLSSLCSSWFIKSHQENNAFITPHGIFCYKVMPFGLKTFMDCQIRYLSLEKLVLDLVLTLRKLMHYFQAHSIAVYTEFLLIFFYQKKTFMVDFWNGPSSSNNLT